MLASWWFFWKILKVMLSVEIHVQVSWCCYSTWTRAVLLLTVLLLIFSGISFKYVCVSNVIEKWGEIAVASWHAIGSIDPDSRYFWYYHGDF